MLWVSAAEFMTPDSPFSDSSIIVRAGGNHSLQTIKASLDYEKPVQLIASVFWWFHALAFDTSEP
jgi:hypothetical protein